MRVREQGRGPHSTTVPSIWKKGRPTDVCQFWGLFKMRLLRVSRLPDEKQARQQWQGWVRAGRGAYILVFWPAYASGKSVNAREGV